jgi:hypothetical protein
MELTRPCANCQNDFKPTADWQKCCTPRCTNALRQRRFRAKHRKDGGGGGGGNGGGGGERPTLFDTIKPQDDRAIYVPDTCYRTPEVEPVSTRRKPATPASQRSNIKRAAVAA